ncbi:MAG: arsenate reductase ArsC [Chloroherpetonaceae bacterium]|nr:arsenate reductase ArsC [Chloroherpetonaceae bacterium]
METQTENSTALETAVKQRSLLFICTANAIRSQMAEGFLKARSKDFIVYSAGSSPVPFIDRHAVQVMKEIGIDITEHYTNSIDDYRNVPLDIAITLCGNAYEVCPVWLYSSSTILNAHWGFKDAAGRNIEAYRKLRDELDHHITKFLAGYSPSMTNDELKVLLRKLMR